ncbi:hypothetical protein ACFFHJ_15505 [Planotetraspora thailandica]|uniref:hypothetical protein n=1 Tax=Planotetraspora thailandica TaxID=487172 RepID=UPI00194E43F4|nr:hypothetical protein [Planotetraspora thailandica]
MSARRLLAGLLIAAGVTSCGLFGGGADEIPTPRTAADLGLPLDAYDLTAAEHKVVDKARFMMLADCTRTFGIELEAPPPSADGPERPKNADLLAWLEDWQVEKYGYAGPPPRLTEDFTSYSVSDAQWVVLEGRRRTLRGKAIPPGGCRGSAEALLDQGTLSLLGGKAATLREKEEVFSQLAGDAAQSAYDDLRRRDADRAWRDCMVEAGFFYPNIEAAAGDSRWASTPADDQIVKPRGTGAEIATATADAECRKDTNYYGVRQAAYRDSQQRIIAQNRAELDRIKIINQAELKNARKFLAGQLAVTW